MLLPAHSLLPHLLLESQKCDRQIPCSLCVSRGIPQLCRWEPLVARPAPQRPPEGAPVGGEDSGTHQSTIAALSARIAALEQTILRQNALVQGAANTAASGTCANTDATEQFMREFGLVGDAGSSSAQGDDLTGSGCCPPPDDSAELSRYDFEVQLAAIKMAQMSLAPQNEYIGGGTILCAIHKVCHGFDERS